MVYADYEYYFEKYLGTIPENSFNSLILKSSKIIDNNVNTRLNESKISNLSEEAQDQLKYTACALIDLISKKESNKLSSISIDGVSKTFKTVSEEEYKTSKREILNGLPDELTCYL